MQLRRKLLLVGLLGLLDCLLLDVKRPILIQGVKGGLG